MAFLPARRQVYELEFSVVRFMFRLMFIFIIWSVFFAIEAYLADRPHVEQGALAIESYLADRPHVEQGDKLLGK